MDQANEEKQLVLLYHFLHPDDVVSARLFTDLALSATRCNVIAMPSVRSCHDGKTSYPQRERWQGVNFFRVWRPNWKQSSNLGRVLNSLFMILVWTWRSIWLPRKSEEIVVIGTDPPLSVLVAIPWRVFRPRSKIIHWCHDLYPDAAVADGLLKPTSLVIRLLNSVLRIAYARCDVIADLGSCMRERLLDACKSQRLKKPTHITITPWGLAEPPILPSSCPELRLKLFGHAKLGILYSGNMGRAHCYKQFLQLATKLERSDASFCFAGRGPQIDNLKRQLSQANCENVSFAGFASEAELEQRLSAADIHMVSLTPEWTGTVIPSKFFGALAVGRPVLFAGSSNSAIAKWIKQFKVGWVLDSSETLDRTVLELLQIANDSNALKRLQQHCFEVYNSQFSRVQQLQNWLSLINSKQ